ncbi:MAG: DUF1987 domain-containing protein [Cyclobacteriaceae bacterium]
MNLIIAPSRNTPYIRIDSEIGLIRIEGKSSPENATSFYFPLIDRIKSIFSENNEDISVEVALHYFNTSSSKCLFNLFKALNELENEIRNVSVSWIYEDYDEDMREAGEDYEDIFNLRFNYIEIDSRPERKMAV